MSKKVKGLIILLIAYLGAFSIGYASFLLLEDYVSIIWNLLIADVIATIYIWIIGIFYKTASIYDPYWSVQTVVIFICLMIGYKTFNLGSILYLACLLFWAIRLTYNFIYGFNDITYIDWRYAQIKQKTGKLYQPVSLLGIHLVPTLVVFFSSVPSFLYIINGQDFSLLQLIGLAIMILGTLLELVSDKNMATFKKVRTNKDEIINVGLWKYSRHPNYLGEILFWYGVALVFILNNLNLWFVIVGAILNTLLFLFISIPLAENHLKSYKKGFDEYKNKTRMLLPIKKG